MDIPEALFAFTILLNGDFERDDPFLVFPDGSGEKGAAVKDSVISCVKSIKTGLNISADAA